MSEDKKILVLGVGNILYTDEGTGVRTVERLGREYEFSDNVTLFDGGTLGMRLMDPIMEHDLVIVVDIVLGEGEPGSMYRLTGEDLRKSVSFNDSMHQIDLEDTLVYCDLAGSRPECVVMGIEPWDYKTMAIEVSTEMDEQMPDFMQEILKEVEKSGGSWKQRPEPLEVPETTFVE